MLATVDRIPHDWCPWSAIVISYCPELGTCNGTRGAYQQKTDGPEFDVSLYGTLDKGTMGS
jgi:hypothetical protein